MSRGISLLFQNIEQRVDQYVHNRKLLKPVNEEKWASITQDLLGKVDPVERLNFQSKKPLPAVTKSYARARQTALNRVWSAKEHATRSLTTDNAEKLNGSNAIALTRLHEKYVRDFPSQDSAMELLIGKGAQPTFNDLQNATHHGWYRVVAACLNADHIELTDQQLANLVTTAAQVASLASPSALLAKPGREEIIHHLHELTAQAPDQFPNLKNALDVRYAGYPGGSTAEPSSPSLPPPTPAPTAESAPTPPTTPPPTPSSLPATQPPPPPLEAKWHTIATATWQTKRSPMEKWQDKKQVSFDEPSARSRVRQQPSLP